MIHLLMRFLPFWAGGMALISAQVGVFFHRKQNPKQWIFWFLFLVCIVLMLLWFFFRGDQNSDAWVKEWFGTVNEAITF